MFPQGHSTLINGLDQILHHNHHHMMPMERSTSRWKPNIEIAPNCPRCASTNTKFCYYNNYSLSQPRYFCKACRRYWTKGGSLRNVPVGGGCRKNRRPAKSSRNPRLSPHASSASHYSHSSAAETSHPSNASRDIDMALVFAKFLNQKPNSTSAAEEFENGSSSSNNYSTPPESYNNNSNNNNNNYSNDIDKGLLSDSDPNSLLTIENFGIDELEGFLWSVSDDAATMSSSVTWQPPLMQMQLQELEYSVPLNDDDQLLLPIGSESDMNSIGDSWSNWSSFDLSTMQEYSPQRLN